MRVQRILFAGPLLAFTYLDVSRASEQPSTTVPLEAGAWKEVSGDKFLRVEAERLIIFESGSVKAVTILGKADDRITVRNQGLKEVWKLTLADSRVRLERNGVVSEFSPLPKAVPELDLTPFPLGSTQKLTPERVRTIQEELLKRRDLDQSVRKDPAQKARQSAVDSENFGYLKKLLKEVGWIDADRFGKAATAAAIVLVKHSADPRVMQSILPLIEKDVKGGTVSAELFAILFDGLQLSLGRRQRFGSQLWEDEKGPFVIPLEDPARVDQFRREIGLPSLSEYRKQASEYLYENKEVRLLSED